MTTLTQKILVVDDESHIRRLLCATLTRAGYLAQEAASAQAAMTVLAAQKPDAVLLDLGLLDRDGIELVPLIKKQSDAAVLIVSAREETSEKVAALDLGADDYVTKPFDTDELLARLRGSLRRRVLMNVEAETVRAGDVEIDLVNRLVRKDGVEVHLTPKEYGFLAELAKYPGRVFTHAQLLRAVWGGVYDQHVEYVRVVVRNIRQKLEDDPANPKLVVNELGVGYRLKGGAQ
ncbi:MAG: DNA-binding response regulator KdpE [uncultured Sphingomonadaceae bacterium]|uniref:DNA-binding response regulator KdpE n=1 Tax=uncultured Sphingomonadaceae bacterium TaxID=169976 RepID=A0A6J4TPG3_9SPHN|nr:MAG: DNA-binding response regulator KdpE [uncultured Sphingomonadaceae bacterium]